MYANSFKTKKLLINKTNRIMKNINNIIFYLILVRNYSLKSLGRVFIFPGEILFGILTSLENNQGKPSSMKMTKGICFNKITIIKVLIHLSK